ncbi:MAG TPA: DNA polymerase III subunit gamma/tau [Gemmatimonadaceae bacterium]
MIALARKYRPRKFADVAVQSHVSNTLKGAIAAGRVAHGYLLAGPRGVGKTTLARVLAMALNCEKGSPGGEPCGECPSCTRIWAGSASLDVVEIDAASNRGVDDARELRERAMYAPSGDDRYKVYIVDEAHMLMREAWNALLKILEEPPPRVVFVFATPEPYKIAQAAAPVLSRLQRFDFKRMGPADIRARLEAVLALEKVKTEPEALTMISRAADGSMRDALSLTDQVLAMGDGALTATRARDALGLVPEDEYLALLDLIAERKAAEVFPFIGKLADAGIDFGQFVAGLGDMLRGQLAVNLGGEATDVSDHARKELGARRGRISPADLLRMLNVMGDSELRFKRSSQQQLLVETMLVRFALMDRTANVEDMLKAMGGASAGSGGASGARGRPAPSYAPQPEPMRAAPPASSASNVPPPVMRSSPSPTLASSAEPRAESPKPRAESPEPRTESLKPRSRADVNAVAGRWDDLVSRVRGTGKALLAAALEASSPVAITAKGDLTIELDEPNDFHAKAIEQARDDVLAILGEWFEGTHGLRLYREDAAPKPQGQAADRPKRVTDEMVKSERLSALRKKDASLDAAVEVLDLEIDDRDS